MKEIKCSKELLLDMCKKLDLDGDEVTSILSRHIKDGLFDTNSSLKQIFYASVVKFTDMLTTDSDLKDEVTYNNCVQLFGLVLLLRLVLDVREFMYEDS